MDGFVSTIGFLRDHPEVLALFTLVQFGLLAIHWKTAKDSRKRIRNDLNAFREQFQAHAVECAKEKGRMIAHIEHEHDPALPNPLPEE